MRKKQRGSSAGTVRHRRGGRRGPPRRRGGGLGKSNDREMHVEIWAAELAAGILQCPVEDLGDWIEVVSLAAKVSAQSVTHGWAVHSTGDCPSSDDPGGLIGWRARQICVDEPLSDEEVDAAFSPIDGFVSFETSQTAMDVIVVVGVMDHEGWECPQSSSVEAVEAVEAVDP